MIQHDDELQLPLICRRIDAFVTAVGNALAWFNIVLVLCIILQVVLRYVFGLGQVYLEELQWHIFGALIMFAYGYCITQDAHIRLDIFHRRFSAKKKEVVELLGHLFLLLPLIAVLFIHGIDFVESSYRVNEASDSPLGLPWRWLIKSAIPVSMIFAAIAVFSRIIRSISIILRK